MWIFCLWHHQYCRHWTLISNFIVHYFLFLSQSALHQLEKNTAQIFSQWLSTGDSLIFKYLFYCICIYEQLPQYSKRSFVLFFYVRLDHNKSIWFSSIFHSHEQLHICLFNIRHSSLNITKNPGIKSFITQECVLSLWSCCTMYSLTELGHRRSFSNPQKNPQAIFIYIIAHWLLLPLSLSDNSKLD